MSLLPLLDDGRKQVGAAAKKAIDELSAPACDRLRRALVDPSRSVRRNAARLLGCWWLAGQEDLAALSPLLKDPDRGVREAAAQSLIEIRHRRGRDLHG